MPRRTVRKNRPAPTSTSGRPNAADNTNVLLAVPALILALALASFLRGDPSKASIPAEFVLIIALGIVSTPAGCASDFISDATAAAVTCASM